MIIASYSMKETGHYLFDIILQYHNFIWSQIVQDNIIFYTPDCYRLFSNLDSPRTERRTQDINISLICFLKKTKSQPISKRKMMRLAFLDYLFLEYYIKNKLFINLMKHVEVAINSTSGVVKFLHIKILSFIYINTIIING